MEWRKRKVITVLSYDVANFTEYERISVMLRLSLVTRWQREGLKGCRI